MLLQHKIGSAKILATLALIALCLSPAAVRAQEATATPPPQAGASPAAAAPVQQPNAIIKKESRLVLVDAVVTDKKGNYVHDLKQSDFKVYEDNKEQHLTTFSAGADIAVQANAQRRYLILFFDNASMAPPDQIQARGAAAKFIEANAGPDKLMAVVDFGGTIRVSQNFTANADALQSAVRGVKYSSVNSNPAGSDSSGSFTVASTGLSSLSDVEADYGARTMLLGVRSLAKNLRAVPGRKMLVLFSSGFALTPENESELTATIDACNKANVAIYALDSRGLVGGGPSPAGAARNVQPGNAQEKNFSASNRSSRTAASDVSSSGKAAGNGPRLVLTSYTFTPSPDPQHGGTGGTGGGGTGGGAGGAGGSGGKGGTGGTSGTGGTGGKGGTGGTSGAPGGTAGGKGGAPGGTAGGGTTGRPGGGAPVPFNNSFNNPYNQSRTIVPQFPPSVATNQQILAALADGTGGFTIFNTNDLLGGLQKIGREQSEFYLLGYVPGESPEGSCHTLKVKMNSGGMNVRARSGYCNSRVENPLDGTPVEKQLELRAAGTQTGSIHGALEVPYFYTGPNLARVNLAMEIPSDSFNFKKEKGKYHATLDVVGIAYKPDGSVGAHFSDTVNLDLEKDDWKEFTKSPYKYQNQFDAAAGTYKLTVVLSGGGDTFGKFETPLKIDSYDGKRLSIGGVALSNSVQRVSDIPTGLDSVLLEDRTPLVVKGMEVVPSANNHFKRTDNVIMYTEIYEPLLTADPPARVIFAYRVFDRATNKEIFFTGIAPADDFVKKGNPVIPAGMMVKVKDLTPGSYRMVVQAADSANNQAANRQVDFDITD
jgi:VWFA-related protein